jgi:predicted GTPase
VIFGAAGSGKSSLVNTLLSALNAAKVQPHPCNLEFETRNQKIETRN